MNQIENNPEKPKAKPKLEDKKEDHLNTKENKPIGEKKPKEKPDPTTEDSLVQIEKLKNLVTKFGKLEFESNCEEKEK